MVFTYHLAMKFPIEDLVGDVRGDQAESRQCYAMSTRVGEKHKIVNAVLHLEDVEVPLTLSNISHMLGELDLRENEKRGGPIKELDSIKLDDQHPERAI